jgi:ferric-dicitrate binding protein FerR (iron transport regulator)
VLAYEKDTEIETVLLEGKVTVYRNRDKGFSREKVVLKPYQKASFNRQKNTLEVSEEKDVEDCISWISGWLYFSQKSLPYVFSKVERYYNVRIVVPEDFRASSLISGKLDIKGSLEDVMRVLSDVGKFSYRIDDHTIYIE